MSNRKESNKKTTTVLDYLKGLPKRKRIRVSVSGGLL